METPEKLDQIAEEIRKVSKAIRRFRDGPLTDRCIVALLHDATRLPKKTIQIVLDGLDGLEQKFLKKQKG